MVAKIELSPEGPGTTLRRCGMVEILGIIAILIALPGCVIAVLEIRDRYRK
jgi:hypothetical protein